VKLDECIEKVALNGLLYEYYGDIKVKLRNWLIKKLGGVTRDEQEEKRASHERWAIEHLTGKNGEVTPDCAHYFPFPEDDICIIRSRMSVTNQKIKGLKIAPWCKGVVCG